MACSSKDGPTNSQFQQQKSKERSLHGPKKDQRGPTVRGLCKQRSKARFDEKNSAGIKSLEAVQAGEVKMKWIGSQKLNPRLGALQK